MVTGPLWFYWGCLYCCCTTVYEVKAEIGGSVSVIECDTVRVQLLVRWWDHESLAVFSCPTTSRTDTHLSGSSGSWIFYTLCRRLFPLFLSVFTHSNTHCLKVTLSLFDTVMSNQLLLVSFLACEIEKNVCGICVYHLWLKPFRQFGLRYIMECNCTLSALSALNYWSWCEVGV